MGVNKVVYNGNTLIDVSRTNVAADKLLKGYSAIGPNGELIEGSLEQQSYDFSEVNVTADKMLKGTYAFDSSGNLIEGSIDVDEILNIINNKGKFNGYDNFHRVEIFLEPQSGKTYRYSLFVIAPPPNSSMAISIDADYIRTRMVDNSSYSDIWKIFINDSRKSLPRNSFTVTDNTALEYFTRPQGSPNSALILQNLNFVVIPPGGSFGMIMDHGKTSQYYQQSLPVSVFCNGYPYCGGYMSSSTISDSEVGDFTPALNMATKGEENVIKDPNWMSWKLTELEEEGIRNQAKNSAGVSLDPIDDNNKTAKLSYWFSHV